MHNTKFISFGLLGIAALIGSISSIQAQQVKDNLAEDQIIVCVNGAVVGQTGNICHKYNVDDFDYYQDAYDGSLFDLDDSFDMAVVD